MLRDSPAPTKGIRRNRTAPDAASAVLSYWYGLSGSLSKLLLELYLSPRGLTDNEIHAALRSHATSQVSKVYICWLRQRLRETLEGVDPIIPFQNPRRAGQDPEIQNRRYRLTPAMREDVRETLEIAFEQMEATIAQSRRLSAPRNSITLPLAQRAPNPTLPRRA